MDKHQIVSNISLLIDIEQETCNVFGIDICQLVAKTKSQPMPCARRVVMVIASLYGIPHQLIAQRLCIDRTSVSKARESKLLKVDRRFDNVFSKMKKIYGNKL